MSDSSPSMLKATAIGGSAAGFVAAVPLVGAVNLCCCLLVVGGGFLAAFLYSRDCRAQGAEFKPGSGALVGLVAAMFYAAVTSIVGTLVQLVIPVDPDQVMDQLDQVELPPEALEWIQWALELSGSLLGFIFGFFFWLLIAAVFSTVGGLIGGAVFKVEPDAPAPPAAPADAPPPTPPAPPGESGS